MNLAKTGWGLGCSRAWARLQNAPVGQSVPGWRRSQGNRWHPHPCVINNAREELRRAAGAPQEDPHAGGPAVLVVGTIHPKRSNQSILKEINPEYSLEGLMLKLKLQYFGHMIWRANSLEKTLMLGLKAGGEGDSRGWDGWMALLTQWARVWSKSGSWWWTGRPGMLQSMGSKRVRHDWATQQYTAKGTNTESQGFGVPAKGSNSFGLLRHLPGGNDYKSPVTTGSPAKAGFPLVGGSLMSTAKSWQPLIHKADKRNMVLLCSQKGWGGEEGNREEVMAVQVWRTFPSQTRSGRNRQIKRGKNSSLWRKPFCWRIRDGPKQLW